MYRDKGRLVNWDDDKGYGFISPLIGCEAVFLHVSELPPHQRRPRVGDLVTYQRVCSANDRPNATRAKICGFAWSAFTLLCASAVPILGLYLYAAWRHRIPFYPMAIVYAFMSLITITAYHHDKCAAMTGNRRVPEKKLHLLELSCGWPGAFLAQLFFRHKLKKITYQITFWMIVIGHGLAWYALAAESPVRQLAKDFPMIRASKDDSQVPVPVPMKTVSATPSPVEVNAWTNDTPFEPLISDCTVRRGLVIAHKRSRRVIGTIRAISAKRGLLVALPSDIGDCGIIPSSALIGDFHRRFRAGEQVTVAIQGISMKGSQKQIDLLLVEP